MSTSLVAQRIAKLTAYQQGFDGIELLWSCGPNGENSPKKMSELPRHIIKSNSAGGANRTTKRNFTFDYSWTCAIALAPGFSHASLYPSPLPRLSPLLSVPLPHKNLLRAARFVAERQASHIHVSVTPARIGATGASTLFSSDPAKNWFVANAGDQPWRIPICMNIVIMCLLSEKAALGLG